MELVAAILWLVLSQQGITPGHLVDWVANGSFPLLNAFYNLLDNLLDCHLQEQLLPIAYFFLMSAPPRASRIERYAAHLAIATGIQSTLEMPQYSASDEQQDNATTTNPVILKRQ
jgi:hypothetical protein